ncbi:MAG: MltR family transcriptional regulator, partial [Enterobacterales bacterium]|nr:MltR family transcriptional regulator [Enterobacterales bacterium]
MKLNRVRNSAQPERERELPSVAAPEKQRYSASEATTMATMEESDLYKSQAFENRILERLNARQTVAGFIQATVGLLAEAVDLLGLQAFRKDDYAVKY